jgi:HSP20 family protein
VGLRVLRRFPSIEILSRYQAEMERLFQEALSVAGRDGGEWQPEIDVVETNEVIAILVEVPGLSVEQVTVEVKGTQVTISGNKTTPLPPLQRLRFHCIERGHGRFRREVQLYGPINSHAGRARLADGLLTIEFPKVQEKRHAARILPIEGSGDPA